MVGIKLTKHDDRPWEEKWKLILHNRDRLYWLPTIVGAIAYALFHRR